MAAGLGCTVEMVRDRGGLGAAIHVGSQNSSEPHCN